MPQRIPQTVTKLVYCALLLVGPSAWAGDILVRLDGKQAGGSVHLALVQADQPGWPEQPVRMIHSDDPLLRLRNIPPGRFAIQVFQDSNGNGVLDLTPRGLPLEPVGFSNNPSLLGGKPTPSKSTFVHGSADSELLIRLHAPRKKP
ncbi:DUF2141 domain-containing protein [Pseudomonas sp. PDM14]|uniref:DUF2141 domain-containing protein n=1 Tax=Pseudomonas sp. PDM14 TaxID=2769288 RepID=UPI00177EEF5D|nr:DUF2141 domain-containing protein [Pseudomonas sp. PDM14]MBD9482876.1 DUF2141 domain-containing protein [Pseudomonas sp. PDM14]